MGEARIGTRGEGLQRRVVSPDVFVVATDAGSARLTRASDGATTDGDGQRLLRLATKCATVDEFVAQFHPFVDETSAFVPGKRLEPGTTCRLLITLKDGSAVMNARCKVREAAPSGARAPSGATRLELVELDGPTKHVHRRLLARRRQQEATRAASSAGARPKPPAPIASKAPELRPASGSPPIAPAPRVPGGRPIVTLVPPTRAPGLPAATKPDESAEARVPPAAYQLPANPFSELSPDALAAFIDCTLFEEHEASAAKPTPVPAAPPEATAAAEPVPPPSAAAAEPRVATPVPAPSPAPRWRHLVWKIAPFAACSAISVVVGYAMRGGTSPGPPPVVSPRPVAAAASMPTAAPAPAVCRAVVSTEPLGATVVWGGVALGATPLENVKVPCGPATVELRLANHASVTRHVSADASRPATLSETLARAKGILRVTSTPSGALLTLDGKWRVGTTPRELDVALGERVTLEARHRGYRPWSQSVELAQATTEVDVRLERAAGSKHRAKRAAPVIDFVDGVGAPSAAAKRAR